MIKKNDNFSLSYFFHAMVENSIPHSFGKWAEGIN